MRPSHAANDGKIFAWDDPPPTGHPGEGHGCRCCAEAYVPDAHEFFDIQMQNVSDEGRPWEHRDFIRHYFTGEGRTVTVRQTGHLRPVVAEFKRQAGDVPTRLSGQIADKARRNIGGHFDGKFGRPYPMQDIVFSLGETTITGAFYGTCQRKHALLELRGEINYELSDEFRDPMGIEDRVLEQIGAVGMFPTELPAAEPYRIVDRWTGTFSAMVHMDRARSAYRYEKSR